MPIRLVVRGVTSAVLNAPGSAVATSPAIMKRTAVGPDGKLYMESGAQQPITPASFFDPVRESCLTQNVPGTPALPATVLADLDELFVPPFTVR